KSILSRTTVVRSRVSAFLRLLQQCLAVQRDIVLGQVSRGEQSGRGGPHGSCRVPEKLKLTRMARALAPSDAPAKCRVERGHRLDSRDRLSGTPKAIRPSRQTYRGRSKGSGCTAWDPVEPGTRTRARRSNSR